jgi:DNA-binding MarR family transcriptional regulator
MRNQGRVEGNDLTPTQLAVLATLDRHGSMRLGELASHERVQPPSMTKTVEALVARGLEAREQQAADRRQVVVTLCAEGQALLAADRQSRDKWLARRLAELTPAEHDLLERAAALLDRLGTE